MKTTHRGYGFPVVSGQEKALVFHRPAQVTRVADGVFDISSVVAELPVLT